VKSMPRILPLVGHRRRRPSWRSMRCPAARDLPNLISGRKPTPRTPPPKGQTRQGREDRQGQGGRQGSSPSRGTPRRSRHGPAAADDPAEGRLRADRRGTRQGSRPLAGRAAAAAEPRGAAQPGSNQRESDLSTQLAHFAGGRRGQGSTPRMRALTGLKTDVQNLLTQADGREARRGRPPRQGLRGHEAEGRRAPHGDPGGQRTPADRRQDEGAFSLRNRRQMSPQGRQEAYRVAGPPLHGGPDPGAGRRRPGRCPGRRDGRCASQSCAREGQARPSGKKAAPRKTAPASAEAAASPPAAPGPVAAAPAAAASAPAKPDSRWTCARSCARGLAGGRHRRRRRADRRCAERCPGASGIELHVAQADGFSRVEFRGAPSATAKRDGQVLTLDLPARRRPDISRLRTAPPNMDQRPPEKRHLGGHLQIVFTLAADADAKVDSADGTAFVNVFQKAPAHRGRARGGPRGGAEAQRRTRSRPAACAHGVEGRQRQVLFTFAWAIGPGGSVPTRRCGMGGVRRPATLDVSMRARPGAVLRRPGDPRRRLQRRAH